MGTSSKEPANWHLQRTRRSKGSYYQAIFRSGKDRRAITLGYLLPERAEEIKGDMQEAGAALLHLTDEQVKSWALEPRSRTQLLNIGLSPRTLARMTLREFVEAEFREWRRSQVAAGTWKVEEPRLNRLVAVLGHVKLANLTTYRWERHLMTRDVSPRTKKLEENVYKEVLKRAHHLGAIPSIHAFGTIRGSTKTTLPKEPFTPDEVRRLLAHAPSPMHRALFGLCVGVGLRPGEVVRVRWEDVGVSTKGLLDGSLRVRGTKTDGSAATIPLTPFAWHELDLWWSECGEPRQGLVFSWQGKPIGSFKTALESAARRAGIDRGGLRRIHPYMLRTSFASMAACGNVPPIVAQKIMRHTSSKMLLEIYAQAGAQQLREGLENFPLRT